jgi:hypothetical protein
LDLPPVYLAKPISRPVKKQFYTTKLDTKLTPEQRMMAEQVAVEIERENKMCKNNVRSKPSPQKRKKVRGHRLLAPSLPMLRCT